MTTFSEANQTKLSLKMQLHFFSWFNSISVITEDGGDYGVLVLVNGLNDSIRKVVPTVKDDVSVRVINAK